MSQIELFYDKDYEIDCQNKIPYFNILAGRTIEEENLLNHIIEKPDDVGEITLFSEMNTLIITGTKIEDIHVKNKSGRYCYEKMIGTNVKKVILE